MTRRYALRDDQWVRIQDLLPGREGYVAGRAGCDLARGRAFLARRRPGGRDGPDRAIYPANVERLRDHYEHLPEKLRAQNVNPRIPWLYDFKLDFRFR